jgi:hypothetical protein
VLVHCMKSKSLAERFVFRIARDSDLIYVFLPNSPLARSESDRLLAPFLLLNDLLLQRS